MLSNLSKGDVTKLEFKHIQIIVIQEELTFIEQVIMCQATFWCFCLAHLILRQSYKTVIFIAPFYR